MEVCLIVTSMLRLVSYIHKLMLITNLLGRHQNRLMVLIWVRIRSVNKYHNSHLKGYFCSKTVFNLSKTFSLKRRLKFWKKGLILHLLKNFKWTRAYKKILSNFPAECDVIRTFVMKYLTISVKHRPSDLNLYGNHLKVMRVYKRF